MKLLSILYEDSKDLSPFVNGMEVRVASTDGSVLVSGGKIFAESRIPNPEVLAHTHETTGEISQPITE